MTRKRCPNGTRKNRLGSCEPKDNKKLKTKKKSTIKNNKMNKNDISPNLFDYQIRLLKQHIKEQKKDIKGNTIAKTNNKEYEKHVKAFIEKCITDYDRYANSEEFNKSYDTYLAYLRIISQREADKLPPKKMENFWKEQSPTWEYQPYNAVIDNQILLNTLTTYSKTILYKMRPGPELTAIQLIHKTLPDTIPIRA